jgi:DNA-binding MarR family transcriptional regulator
MHQDQQKSEASNLETEIYSCLKKILNAAEIYSSRLKDKTGLNASQLACLLALGSSGPLPLSKLSRKVFLSPSMITAIVDQLEKRELVVRARKSNDRRVIMIVLTKKGEDTVKNSPPSFQQQLMKGLRELKAEEKKTLHKSLETLSSLMVSEVLSDTVLLEGEESLVEVEPAVLKIEESKQESKLQ